MVLATIKDYVPGVMEAVDKSTAEPIYETTDEPFDETTDAPVSS